mgnify:CR=1 FL=1|jgi:transposase
MSITYVGIDVSKATFVVAYSPAKDSRTREFKNTVKGILEFIRTISATKHTVPFPTSLRHLTDTLFEKTNQLCLF